jgi:hypothetical protein
MYLNPYYRHVADLKREFALGVTKGHIKMIIDMLSRKAERGNLKAANMLLKAIQMQSTLDHRYDDKHEIEIIMGSPTDGLMKSMRPGGIVLHNSLIDEDEKKHG